MAHYDNLMLVDDEHEEILKFKADCRERQNYEDLDKREARRKKREALEIRMERHWGDFIRECDENFHTLVSTDPSLGFLGPHNNGVMKWPPFVRYVQQQLKTQLGRCWNCPDWQGVLNVHHVQAMLRDTGWLDDGEIARSGGWEQGNDYEQEVFEWLEDEGIDLIPYRWFIWSAKGMPLSYHRNFRQVDGIERADDMVILYEAKSSWCGDAHKKVSKYYKPLCESYFGLPVHVVVICPTDRINSCGSCDAGGDCQGRILLESRQVIEYGVVGYDRAI